jgi:hypothetical protein
VRELSGSSLDDLACSQPMQAGRGASCPSQGRDIAGGACEQETPVDEHQELFGDFLRTPAVAPR